MASTSEATQGRSIHEHGRQPEQENQRDTEEQKRPPEQCGTAAADGGNVNSPMLGRRNHPKGVPRKNREPPRRGTNQHEWRSRHVHEMLMEVELDEADDFGRDHVFVRAEEPLAEQRRPQILDAERDQQDQETGRHQPAGDEWSAMRTQVARDRPAAVGIRADFRRDVHDSGASRPMVRVRISGIRCRQA
jgi:hypothetical protein